MLEMHANGPSSRERDLVDLALLTLTEAINGRNLRFALMSEFARRSTRAPEQFTTPDSWGVRYRRDAADIELLANYRDVESARNLVAKLIEPVLLSAEHAGTWSPQRLQWQPL